MSIIINGLEISNKENGSIIINGTDIIIDGEKKFDFSNITDNNISVSINGDIQSLECSACTVYGNVKKVDCNTAIIEGDVLKDVDANTATVYGNVKGDINTNIFNKMKN